MVRILGREVEARRTVGIFYVEVVQAVILFGSEMWVVTPCLEKAIAGSTTGPFVRWRAWATNSNWTGHGYIHPLGRCWQWCD